MLDTRAQRRQRWRNLAQGALLLGCLLAVAASLAWMLLGLMGLLGALALGLVVLLTGPEVPAGAVLGAFRAQPLPPAAAPDVHWMVQVLAGRARLHRPPELFYVPSPVPNCITVGRGDDTALAVTDGLLRRLTRRELAGVLAHEIGHLQAGDPRIMALSDAISRLTRWLCYVGVFSFLIGLPLVFQGEPRLLVLAAVLVALPFVVTLLQLALSRSREFDADLSAARLTGDPEGLACALEVLEASTGRLWERILLGRGYVSDPLLLRTHPSTAERARRLRELEPPAERWFVVGRPAAAGYPQAQEPVRSWSHGPGW